MNLVLKDAEPSVKITMQQAGNDIDFYANGLSICFIDGETGRVMFFTQTEDEIEKLTAMGFVIRNHQVAHE